jgi:predicted RNA binding protein YcfA (HicA-like mRNA interferase family)
MPSEVRFAEVRKLLEAKGYRLDRVRGSHHVFERPGSGIVIVPVHHGKVKYGYVRKIEKID